MDAPSGQTEVAEKLVNELNTLLASLLLPTRVITPYDLTPSLLLVILESILRERLPISVATRESRTPSAKVEAMKVFLGVLEDDVLRTDIGLSEIDPRRLAAGEWDEVVFVGETLCWLGRRQESQGELPFTLQTHPESSSADSNANTSVYMGFSRNEASETTVTTLPSELSPDVTPITTPRPGSPPSTPQPPRCIHEFEDSSFFSDIQSAGENSADHFCDCSVAADRSFDAVDDEALWHDYHSASPQKLPIRSDGWIELVEGDVEAFEASRERSKSCASAPTFKRNSSTATPGCPRDRAINPTRHTSPAEYTLSLLNERARLLTELANLNLTMP